MSMHEIEDLGEKSIHFIHNLKEITQQEKRDFFLNIFKWQLLYDTSYTHFRVKAILEENNYLFNMSLENFQEYRKLSFDEISKINNENYSWIKGLSDDLIYIENIDNNYNIYFDYGCLTWNTLVEKKAIQENNTPQIWNPLELYNKLILLALEKYETTLAFEWYSVFINSIYEEYIESLSFSELINNNSINELKEKIYEAGYGKYRSSDNLLSKVSWSNIKDDLNQEEDIYYIIKYLTNAKWSKEKAIKSFEQHLKTPKQPISVIKNKLDKFFKVNNWTFTEEKKDDSVKWKWHKDITPNLEPHHKDFKRIFITFEYYNKDEFLFAIQGVQLGKFLKWQKVLPAVDDYTWHFKQNFIASVPNDVLEKNKFINGWGAWHIPLKKNISFIKKRTDNIVEYLNEYIYKYDEYISSLFVNDNYFKNDLDKLIDLILNGDDEGNIPNYIAFDSPLSIYFAYLFQAIENKDHLLVKEITKKIKAYLIDNNNILTKIFLPQIEKLEKNGTINYPLHIHRASIEFMKRELEQQN